MRAGLGGGEGEDVGIAGDAQGAGGSAVAGGGVDGDGRGEIPLAGVGVVVGGRRGRGEFGRLGVELGVLAGDGDGLDDAGVVARLGEDDGVGAGGERELVVARGVGGVGGHGRAGCGGSGERVDADGGEALADGVEVVAVGVGEDDARELRGAGGGGGVAEVGGVVGGVGGAGDVEGDAHAQVVVAVVRVEVGVEAEDVAALAGGVHPGAVQGVNGGVARADVLAGGAGVSGGLGAIGGVEAAGGGVLEEVLGGHVRGVAAGRRRERAVEGEREGGGEKGLLGEGEPGGEVDAEAGGLGGRIGPGAIDELGEVDLLGGPGEEERARFEGVEAEWGVRGEERAGAGVRGSGSPRGGGRSCGLGIGTWTRERHARGAPWAARGKGSRGPGIDRYLPEGPWAKVAGWSE